MLRGTCLSGVWDQILRTDNANLDPDLPVNDDGEGPTSDANEGGADVDDDDDDDCDVDGPTVEAFVDLAKTALRKIYPEDLAAEIERPNFPHLIQEFIYNQQYPDYISNASVPDLPTFYGKITIYPSAVATFYAPSDLSGIGGMRRERIYAVKSWRKGPGRFDTIFVNTDPSMEGMRGLEVARVLLFFSFSHEGIEYPCTLVQWFSCVGDSPDNHTGMWVVKSDSDETTSIIHLDAVVRASHLLPIFGDGPVPRTLAFTDTLNTFNRFYVNKYIDHHAFEIAF